MAEYYLWWNGLAGRHYRLRRYNVNEHFVAFHTIHNFISFRNEASYRPERKCAIKQEKIQII